MDRVTRLAWITVLFVAVPIMIATAIDGTVFWPLRILNLIVGVGSAIEAGSALAKEVSDYD